MIHNQQDENIYQAMINSISDPVFALDVNYQYLIFNKAHADVMKLLYGKNIKTGCSIYDYLVVADDAAKSKKKY